MPVTGNKGWTEPTVGGSSGTWGTELNALIDIIDKNLGGTDGATLGAVNVTLTAAQTDALVLIFTGTLTANVVVTLTPHAGGPAYACGMWVIRNYTTGNFTLTLSNGLTDTVQCSQYLNTLIIGNATGGVYAVASDAFPAGQILVTGNTSAPAGWTKITTHNDKALRLVNAGVGSGGSTPFTNIFAARTISTAQLPAHSHGVTDPGHVHVIPSYSAAGFAGGGGSGVWNNTVPINSQPAVTGISLQNTGSGSSIDFAVQYVDVTLIQKNN